MDKHIATLEELAVGVELDAAYDPAAQRKLEAIRAAIALMRGQSWKRELIDDIQRRFEVGEVPKMTEARAEYWKAGARWAIGIVNVAIHELHNPPKDTVDEQ